MPTLPNYFALGIGYPVSLVEQLGSRMKGNVMAMSRQNYVAIAAVLAGDYASSGTKAEKIEVRAIALSLADVFTRDNPRFDRDKFYAAVGI